MVDNHNLMDLITLPIIFARSQEHARHIEEYTQICKMMIEDSAPILIEQYMSQNKQSVAFVVKAYLNEKIVDYKTALSNAFARVLQRFLWFS